MRYKCFGSRRILSSVLSAALLLPNGGCVPVEEGQWAEFFGDLLLNALAAFLL